mmetsp:Transcript_24844/g.72782  ORF Transcript_24844/g.72782 Transcript_24844/m.72782 type:complete len:582 (-) Transcript_24844:25-1770(-)
MADMAGTELPMEDPVMPDGCIRIKSAGFSDSGIGERDVALGNEYVASKGSDVVYDGDSSGSEEFEEVRTRIAERISLMRRRARDDSLQFRMPMVTPPRRRRMDNSGRTGRFVKEHVGQYESWESGGQTKKERDRIPRRDLNKHRYLAGLSVTCLVAMFYNPGSVQPIIELGTTPPKYDPWDQGQEFRDRGPRPKTKKKNNPPLGNFSDRNDDSGKAIPLDILSGDIPIEAPRNEHDLIRVFANFSPWWTPLSIDTDFPIYWDTFGKDNSSSAINNIWDMCYANSSVVVAKFSALLHSNTTVNETFGLNPNSRPGILFMPSLRNGAAVLKSFARDENQIRGRCFVIIPDPSRKCACSRTLQQTTNLTAKSALTKHSKLVDNLMVRTITNTVSGELSKRHLDLAMSILGRKCLVGLVERREESIRRFEEFFRWTAVRRNDTRQPHCIEWKGLFPKQSIDAGCNATARMSSNQWDSGLYEFALELYQRQGEWLGNYSIGYKDHDTQSGGKHSNGVVFMDSPKSGKDPALPLDGKNHSVGIRVGRNSSFERKFDSETSHQPGASVVFPSKDSSADELLYPNITLT